MGRRPAFLMHALGVPAAAAVERLARLSGRRVGLALMYHGIVQLGDPEWVLAPAFDARLFADQLRHLSRRAPGSYPPPGCRRRSPTRQRGQRFPVAITFDDDDLVRT